MTSSIHGDETAGYVLTLRLIDHLLASYGNIDDITHLVDSTEIWINPLANPDGTYFGGDDTVANAIRNYTTANGHESGVNGNRNFPDPQGGDHPDDRPWWPETEAMMALAAAETFVLSANFHGGIEVVNYPWDTWQRRHPDDDWFTDLARDWADLAQTDSPGGYMTDLDNGITNGYDWYPVEGGRQDFMTFFHGGREVTIELSTTKLIPAAETRRFLAVEPPRLPRFHRPRPPRHPRHRHRPARRTAGRDHRGAGCWTPRSTIRWFAPTPTSAISTASCCPASTTWKSEPKDV